MDAFIRREQWELTLGPHSPGPSFFESQGAHRPQLQRAEFGQWAGSNKASAAASKASESESGAGCCCWSSQHPSRRVSAILDFSPRPPHCIYNQQQRARRGLRLLSTPCGLDVAFARLHRAAAPVVAHAPRLVPSIISHHPSIEKSSTSPDRTIANTHHHCALHSRPRDSFLPLFFLW